MSLRPPLAGPRPVAVTHHGEALVDEFAWLRDRDDPAVRTYLEAENRYAEEVLTPTKVLQERLYGEMLGRIKETDLTVPVRRDGYWYYTRTEAGKQYPIHCRRAGSMEEGSEEVLVDLNQLAVGKSFLSLGDFAVSDDARWLAYSTDDTGYRQYALVVKDLGTGDHLDFRRERVTSVAWARDNLTLFYTVEDAVTKRSHQLWCHRFGMPESVLVLAEPDELFSVAVSRTRDRAWLVASSQSHTTSECRVARADAPQAAWRMLLPRSPDIEYDVDHHGSDFYLRINDTGRNFRVVRVPDVDVVARRFVEIVPHRDSVMLEGVDCFAKHLVISEREAGVPQIAVRRISDAATHRITFPESAYEAGMYANPEWDVDRIRLAYQSLVTPPSIYDYDLERRERTLLKQQEIVGGYEAGRFVSERLHARAADGTPVPISLVRRADVAADGTAACLLQGYGAYGYPYPVSFSSLRLSLLERGVVVAIAHVRGGGELGKPWHDTGRMANKMHSFTDFIACAEYLVAEGHASAERLAIEGGSAGGLLMGAVTNMRPDLFTAVVSQVPFVDVLNSMSDATLPLTVGEYEEWGNPAVPEEYAWLRAYCPYTNLRAAKYPAMLVRTSFNDSQVMYWEAAKYVARLRHLKRTQSPLLLVTNMGAGHGGASGRYDRLREIALDYAFILGAVGADQAELGPPAAAPFRATGRGSSTQ